MDIDEDEDKDTESEDEETPTKSIVKKFEVPINCSIQYIDFEGRSDGRSVKKIISYISPKNLVCLYTFSG